jgi:UPF0755 protein
MAFLLTRPLRRVILAVAVLVIVAVGWFLLQADPIFAGKGREVIVTVDQGDSLSSIASKLHAKGVIASTFAFRIDTFFGAPVVQAGTYELRQGSSFAQVKSILGNQPNVAAVEVSPGLTVKEVAFLVDGVKGVKYADAFARDATADMTPSPYSHGTSLEGLIGAKTYIITPSMSASMLAHKMVQSFNKEAASVGLTPTTTVEGLNAYQLVTAASIVQKEGYIETRYMGKIARVIYNRLARGGPLQMDSTVLYYLGQDGGTVTPAMLKINTPYNTYLYSGLTPTPICTVSKSALEAVLHAPQGTWLYFDTVDRQGKTLFATTFAQQLKNEAIAKKNGMS